MEYNSILDQLPYASPFLFVDTLHKVDENGVEGAFLFKEDAAFYDGHFKDYPVTPGVILTECCAQIGLVCLGIFLLNKDADEKGKIAMSSSEMEFYLPVFPNEKVVVVSKKIYFRFHKLKCEVKMYNSKNKMVCKGVLAGMLKPTLNE
ncbi:MAG: hydroxymyristoyl-ACP dehydratase [Flavobacteriaceae bacterium]|nr:MAG: hydroxymyristoyl-ACP dehydratase [Flavobacteriaceae bacterium]